MRTRGSVFRYAAAMNDLTDILGIQLASKMKKTQKTTWINKGSKKVNLSMYLVEKRYAWNVIINTESKNASGIVSACMNQKGTPYNSGLE